MSPTRDKTKKQRPRPAAPRPVLASVLPLQLGQPGLIAQGKNHRYVVAAGVPGDQLRIVPQRRSVELTRVPPPEDQAQHDEPAGEPSADLALRLADVVEVVEPATSRITPPCPIIRQCGGCAVQEMGYPAQLACKREALVDALAELAVTPGQVGQIAGPKQPFGYRTKLLMVSGGRAGNLRFGFYRRGSTELAPAEGCAVQHPLTLATLAMVRQVLDGAGVEPTSTTSHRGWLHALGIRISPQPPLAEVTLVGRTPKVPGGQRLLERITQLPHVHGVHLCVSPKRSSYPLTEDIRRLSGSRRLPFRVADATFMLSPATFAQTCAEGADLLAERVLAALPERTRCLADLYGGVGLFTRLARGRYGQAVVAESSPSAVADLRHYLKQETAPISVVAGRLEQTIGKVVAARPDVAIVDPPRRGCHARVLEGLTSIPVDRLVYVACGIEALLADGRRLRQRGYRIEQVEAVDMFPHTTHLEVVATFTRRASAQQR